MCVPHSGHTEAPQPELAEHQLGNPALSVSQAGTNFASEAGVGASEPVVSAVGLLICTPEAGTVDPVGVPPVTFSGNTVRASEAGIEVVPAHVQTEVAFGIGIFSSDSQLCVHLCAKGFPLGHPVAGSFPRMFVFLLRPTQ